MTELPEKPIETRTAFYVHNSVILAILADSEQEALTLAKEYILHLVHNSSPGSSLFAVNYLSNTAYIVQSTPPASRESQKRYNEWYAANQHLTPIPPVPPDILDE